MILVRQLIYALVLSASLYGHAAKVQLNPQHVEQLTQLDYLLAVDRLEFYSEGLADYLMDHDQKVASEGVRKLTPEDFANAKLSPHDLNNPDKWNELILSIVHSRSPEFAHLKLKDIEWNYNFFRKKLMEGFKSEPLKWVPEAGVTTLNQGPGYTKRSIPAINGKSILLDAERYISEKTTRALFWDAALTSKSIEFHLGTERDFRQRVSIEGRDVIAEVKTRSANYNKIYLVHDPRTNTYSYAFTRISGDDRIKHLIAQLRIVSFQKKVVLNKDFVRVYGNAHEVHMAQEERLKDLFRTLPKADMVVIGQKSAIAGVIGVAGMMMQIQPDLKKPAGAEKSPINKLGQQVAATRSYFTVTTKPAIVKSGFENIENPNLTNYEIVTSEQASHDISDVLLETMDGRVVRWRFISNMWGDEVVPVAQALRDTGHDKVVYIGTAGAIIGKGLKVGDVAAPAKTYTQDGKLLDLEKPSYGTDFVISGLVLGQVRSPFDETKKWFEVWKGKIDMVELETGYLRENLGSRVSFQPYLLISDIVGSEHETLAVAAADSGKRKNGQLKLLQSLFITNGIKAPIANVDMIAAGASVKLMYQRIEKLRPSRDVTSKLQLTQLALRQGLTTDEQLEALIKAEPAFDRQLLMDKLEKYSSALEVIDQKFAEDKFAIVGDESLLNGTWNPKKPLKIEIMAGEIKADDAVKIYNKELEKIKAVIGVKELEIVFVNYDAQKLNQSIPFHSNYKRILADYYEQKILKKMGLNKEIDNTGGMRFREIIETRGAVRCEAILL